jgi:hypothetical protein
MDQLGIMELFHKHAHDVSAMSPESVTRGFHLPRWQTSMIRR